MNQLIVSAKLFELLSHVNGLDKEGKTLTESCSNKVTILFCFLVQMCLLTLYCHKVIKQVIIFLNLCVLPD